MNRPRGAERLVRAVEMLDIKPATRLLAIR
jgi:hypothetical protein